MKIKLTLFMLFCWAGLSFSQAVTVVGNEHEYEVVYDDTVKSAANRVLSSWQKVGDFKFFSLSMELSKSAAFWDQVLTDTGYVLQEYYVGTSNPTSNSTPFYQVDETNADTVLTITATDSAITSQLQSFHGSGDPEMPPASFVRYRYVGETDLTNALTLKLGLLKQP